MPTDPRASVEPTLEELNAYVDGELDEMSRERVEQHLVTCADCHTRVDGLREAAYAIRSLPMDSPPRSFSIPKQPTRSWSWAPVGWLGASAAAVLVVILGVHQFYNAAGTTASTGTALYAPAQAPKSVNSQASSPATAGAVTQDRSGFAPVTSFPNGTTVLDPGNASRRLVLGTDAAKYSVNATIRVRLILQGSPTQSTDSGTQGLTVRLMRGSVGVSLPAPAGVQSYDGTPVFGASYDIRTLQLSRPAPGDYQLVATWVIPDGSGRVLQATVPITISAS